MRTYRRTIGSIGEHDALAVLTQKGYTKRETNWRCPLGEIDLIVEKDDLLVFVEVKLRRCMSYGSAEEAVNKRKQMRLARVAAAYCKMHNVYNKDIRFDVISVMPEGCDHIEDAFSADGFTV